MKQRISINKLFIANRGEICARIAFTARSLGIETVALTDRKIAPAFLSDVITKFVYVEEETPNLYLDAGALLDLAKNAGCDAVHPGFGFLAESAEFAKKCSDAGLVWLGPNSQSITAMASKEHARMIALKAGIPCPESFKGFDPQDENFYWKELFDFAEMVGYPLLVKASLGGGGKGMRLVESAVSLKDAVIRCSSEARSFFGNASVLVERYLVAPRHVEVQLLCDKHGNVFAIGDRDCSVQRRHQKIIEESPAPDLTDETRRAIHEAAVSLAKAVNYDSAGTVEFLLDMSAKPDPSTNIQPFCFLEMNTRLQVEHPVSEETLGIDIVAWQIKIAQGESLPAGFGNLVPRGHSVEVRIYAEDCEKNFFPSPDFVYWFEPFRSRGIRWDIGIDFTDEISSKFDPMIAKCISTGETREDAIKNLAQALNKTILCGPKNNLAYLYVVLSDSPFKDGPVNTHFILDNHEGLLSKINRRVEVQQTRAAKLLELLKSGAIFRQNHQLDFNCDIASLTQRVFSQQKKCFSEEISNCDTMVVLDRVSECAGFRDIQVRCGRGVSKNLDKNKGQTDFCFVIVRTKEFSRYWVFIRGLAFHHKDTFSNTLAITATKASHEGVIAPVPGRVVSVNVSAPSQVEKGAVLFVLESMKMEFEVRTAKAGFISTVEVKPKDQVSAGDVLAVWKDG